MLELYIIAWMRYKKLQDGVKYEFMVNAVTSNLGVMNAYAFFQDKVIEKEEDIKKFVRNSSIATFLHHTITLSAIMIMAWYDPKGEYLSLEHWSSKDFLLNPTFNEFFWVFGCVLVTGCYSLTVTLYRVPHITSVDANKKNVKEQLKTLEEIRELKDGIHEWKMTLQQTSH